LNNNTRFCAGLLVVSCRFDITYLQDTRIVWILNTKRDNIKVTSFIDSINKINSYKIPGAIYIERAAIDFTMICVFFFCLFFFLQKSVLRTIRIVQIIFAALYPYQILNACCTLRSSFLAIPSSLKTQSRNNKIKIIKKKKTAIAWFRQNPDHFFVDKRYLHFFRTRWS